MATNLDPAAEAAALAGLLEQLQGIWVEATPERRQVESMLASRIAALSGAVRRRCRGCDSPFWLTRDSIEYYERRGWSYPSFCPHCRAVNRLQRGHAASGVEHAR